MKKLMIPMSAVHYLTTRKRIWLKFLIALAPAILFVIIINTFGIKADVDFSEVFKDFVNVQISAVAILISFAIAIITILVSADNPNMQKLKNTTSTNCKSFNEVPLNLFQVLLSNITYNVLIEIIYLAFLIICIFLQVFVGEENYSVLMAISIFFIVHILHILLESIGQMYLTFWK